MRSADVIPELPLELGCSGPCGKPSRTQGGENFVLFFFPETREVKWEERIH
jgi:hypothetical protein